MNTIIRELKTIPTTEIAMLLLQVYEIGFSHGSESHVPNIGTRFSRADLVALAEELRDAHYDAPPSNRVLE
jgi:hypothetical protein